MQEVGWVCCGSFGGCHGKKILPGFCCKGINLGWEDLLEKEMATHSNTLAWKIPDMEEPGRLQSMGSQLDTTKRLHFHFQEWKKDVEVTGTGMEKQQSD